MTEAGEDDRGASPAERRPPDPTWRRAESASDTDRYAERPERMARGRPGTLGSHPIGPDGDRFPGSQWVLAGWWRRAGALVIDGLIIGVGALLLFLVITASWSIGFAAGEEVGVASIIVGLLLAVICASVVAMLYAPAMMARTNGKTLGRMATGIRVVRADGGPITFGFAMLREVAVKALLFGVLGSMTAGLANLLDYLWPLWDQENRALHDFVVDTRSILD